jgi:hypothetical protein
MFAIVRLSAVSNQPFRGEAYAIHDNGSGLSGISDRLSAEADS